MAEMTSRERIITAAMGKEPDRVPVFGVFNDWAWGQVYGRESFKDIGLDPEKSARVMVWACKEMGVDTTSNFLYSHLVVEAIAEASGMNFHPDRWDDFLPSNPRRHYSGNPIRKIAFGNPLIKTMEDAEKLKPADPYKHGNLPVAIKAIELANKELQGEYPIGAPAENPIPIGGKLMGWTQMFMAMKEDVELWKKVEDVAIKTVWEFTKAQRKAGAASFSSHSILPQEVGSEMYPKNPVWQQAEHPPELFKRIKEEIGIGVGVHPCTTGSIESGFEAWKGWLGDTSSFWCPEFGGADMLARAKEELAPATVTGNIHPVDIMLHGSTSDVEEACVDLIRKCAPGGRFILGPGCFLPIDTPYENVKTMVESAKKYGKYPIKI